jgi:hypothetical protein
MESFFFSKPFHIPVVVFRCVSPFESSFYILVLSCLSHFNITEYFPLSILSLGYSYPVRDFSRPRVWTLRDEPFLHEYFRFMNLFLEFILSYHKVFPLLSPFFCGVLSFVLLLRLLAVKLLLLFLLLFVVVQ